MIIAESCKDVKPGMSILFTFLHNWNKYLSEKYVPIIEMLQAV